MAENPVFKTMLATLRAELASAESELREATEVVEKLKTAIRVVEDVATRDTPSRPGASIPDNEAVDPLIRQASSMVEAAEIVLRDVARPLHIQQLMKRMLAKGYQYSKGLKALKNSLVPSLDRQVRAADGVFTKPDRGVYGLREWNARK